MQLRISKGRTTIKLTASEKKTLTDAHNLLTHLQTVGVQTASTVVENLEDVNRELAETFSCEWMPVAVNVKE